MILFAQGSNNWDSTLVAMVDRDKQTLEFLTNEGNQMQMTITFRKAITLFIDYLDYIANT